MQTEKNIWLRMLSMILTLALLISCIPNQVYAMAGEALADWLGANDTAVLQPNATPDPVLSTAHIVAEDESRRGETYKEYVMNNGLRLATVYPSAIHYEENGVWKDIDNTLVAAVASGKAVYQNAAGAWNVRFPKNLSGSDMISITKDEHTVQFGMAGEMRSSGGIAVASVGAIGQTEATNTLAVSSAQTTTAQIQQIDLAAAREAAEHPETVLEKLNSRLSYANVYPNTNVVYDLQGNRLKESVVLQQYDADLWGYRYTLNTGDLVPVLREDQQIDLCDPETDEVVLTMPAPYMLDDNGETSYDVEVVLTQNGSKYLLSYYLPRAWLAEADRAWPVILDPVITLSGIYSNVDDITVAENYNEAVGRGVIQCGYYSDAGAMRFYLQFLQLPILESADVIVEATIRLNKPYNSGTTANIYVHKVMEAWSQTSISWANQPTYDSNSEDDVICKSAGNYTWNITNMVRDWYETENYGMVFKVQSEIENGSTDNWKQFYSSEYNLMASDVPFLSITYQYDITLDQTSASVYKGNALTLTATTIPAGHAVTWESDTPTVASVDENGVVTGLSVGEAVITATMEDGIAANCAIEVLEKTISFGYTADIEVYKKNTITLEVNTEPADAPIIWTSLNPEIATVSNGVVTGISPGNAVIKASLSDDIYAYCEVVILPNIVNITQGTVTIIKDSNTNPTVTLIAETVPPDLPVTWSSSDPTVATVNQSGVVTALKAGDTTITATLWDGTCDSCTVCVRYLGNLNYHTYEMFDDSFNQLYLHLLPSNTENVTWSSSDTNIAIVNQSGYVIPMNPGVVDITASSPDLIQPVSCKVTIRFGERLYWIQNSSNSLLLTSQEIRIFNNTTVIQDEDNSSRGELDYLGQLWRITYIGNEYYTIRPAFKLSLGLSVDNWYNVRLVDIGTDERESTICDNALWKITRYGDDYRFECAGYPGFYMMPYAGSANIRWQMACEDDGTNPACKWNFSGMSIPTRVIIFDMTTGKPLDDRRIGLKKGESRTFEEMNFSVSIVSETGFYQNVTWSTDNTAAVTVSYYGDLKCEEYGVATITATPASYDEVISDSYTIVISEIRITGYEKEYDPDLWNDTWVQGGSAIRYYTNCYAYAINCQRDPKKHNFGCNYEKTDDDLRRNQQPGEFYSNNNPYGQEVDGISDIDGIYTIEDMAEAAEWDFIMHNTLFASGVRFIKNLTGELPAGAYKVYLVLKYVRIEKPGSYHWYRQNPDGTWSHKDGNGPVINTVSEDDDTIIWDPATAAKAIGYDGDGCYFAVIPWNEFYKPSDTNQLQDEAMFSATDYVGQEEMEQSSSTADYDEPTQKRMFFVEYQRLNVDRRSDAQFARKKRFGWR